MRKKSKKLDEKWLIAIDPASRSAGVAVFKNGELQSHFTLTSDHKTWGDRLYEISTGFSELDIPFEKITDFACEYIKGTSTAPMLNAIAGIFIQYLPNAVLNRQSFITASKWKKVIRDVTGEKDPKGAPSLRKYGIRPGRISEDAADAIMIGVAYNVHTG